MRSFYLALCATLGFSIECAFGASVGMPQFNIEFWSAQIFWLILIFFALYIIIWKIFLPKISDSIENRKSRLINDLNETQKLKEKAETKLNEYNKIIQDSKNIAKEVIEENKKKLNKDIENEKQKFHIEIEKELKSVEKEIQNLRKSSIADVNKIAVEITGEVIKQMIGTTVNASKISTVVEEISKRKLVGNK